MPRHNDQIVIMMINDQLKFCTGAQCLEGGPQVEGPSRRRQQEGVCSQGRLPQPLDSSQRQEAVFIG